MTFTLDSIIPFGKYKGFYVKDLLIENESDLKKHLKYLHWVHGETKHKLSEEVLEEIKRLLITILRLDISTYSSRSSKLEHWNDIGAINGLSFQDIYGDFGY